MTLKTWKFGTVRVLCWNSVNYLFDTYIETDAAYEYEYWQLTSGEIVAVRLPQE